MKKLVTISVLMISMSLAGHGQRKIINLPDIPGYVTLKCDFHIHTVFSDGSIWPTVRIDEALRDGLDAIAITDHLEYTPKKDFIPVDYNAAWKICETYAKERNLILIHGAEITRKMPPGHVNALFIKDASLIVKDSVWDSFEAAIKQGAFLQWNHPGWKAQQADGIPKMYDIHRKLIKNGWLHGIEYFNGGEYYPLVFRFCDENNLAITCNSDVHSTISEIYKEEDRPMTLVFAKERNYDSLKEAMFKGRTMAYAKGMLVGREEFARPFFYSSISVAKPYFQNEKSLFLEITNKSAVPFYLINGAPDTPSAVTLAANSVTRIVVNKAVTFPLVYDVRNVITGENEMLKAELKF